MDLSIKKEDHLLQSPSGLPLLPPLRQPSTFDLMTLERLKQAALSWPGSSPHLKELVSLLSNASAQQAAAMTAAMAVSSSPSPP